MIHFFIITKYSKHYNNYKKKIIELPLNTIGKITYVTIEDFL